jgi:copper chaperone CopZ
MKTISILVILALCFSSAGSVAEETDHRCRVLGLFQADCVDDLRGVTEKLPGIALLKADHHTGTATFRFDSAKVFPGAKSPEQLIEHLRNKLNGASQGVFEVRALSALPRAKQKEVKISIEGLDCKGCSYGAYLAVYKIEGVETATASFKSGLVTAWIDPAKTNRAALEEALTKRGVTLKGK